MDGGTVAGTLLVIFVVLKLVHAIAWSWWWVLSPLWIDVAASLLLFGILSVCGISAFGLLRRVVRSRAADR